MKPCDCELRASVFTINPAGGRGLKLTLMYVGAVVFKADGFDAEEIIAV